MRKNKGYQRGQVISALLERGIKVKGSVVIIPKKVDVGIKTWGRIDFLRPFMVMRQA